MPREESLLVKIFNVKFNKHKTSKVVFISIDTGFNILQHMFLNLIQHIRHLG